MQALLLGLLGLFSLTLQQCNLPDGAGASTTTDNAVGAAATPRVQQADVVPIETYLADNPALKRASTAVFAGGCFWCTEAAFERLRGVTEVVSGYTDGNGKPTTYKAVSGGGTDYTEAIYVFYEPSVIDYATLLDVFFTSHDPTQLNRQGPDRGRQYRGGIYPQSAEQRRAAEAYITRLTAENAFSAPVVTEVKDYRHFYVAEGYHQNYYDLNPNQRYIASVSRPKVEKVEKKFADRLKPRYRK